jgi:hypothetical protein
VPNTCKSSGSAFNIEYSELATELVTEPATDFAKAKYYINVTNVTFLRSKNLYQAETTEELFGKKYLLDALIKSQQGCGFEEQNTAKKLSIECWMPNSGGRVSNAWATYL